MKVGTQSAAIGSGIAASATFAVTSTSLADATTGTIAWFSDSAGKTSITLPSGLTATVGNIASNAATVTVAATTSATVGTYYFTVTFGSVTSTVATLAISPVVTFNCVNSSATGQPAQQIIASGGTATTPTAPALSGYVFEGWFSDSGLTTSFAFTTAITANTTLYAKWGYLIADFEEGLYSSSNTSGITLSKINYNAAPAIVTPANIAAVGSSSNTTNALMVVNSNYNCVPYISVTLPAALSTYSTLKFDVYAADGDSTYKSAYVFASNTQYLSTMSWSTANSTYLIGNPSSATSGLGAWTTVSVDLTASTYASEIAAVAKGTAYIGLGLSTNNGAVYFIDNVRVVDGSGTVTTLADFDSTDTAPTIGAINYNAASSIVSLAKFAAVTASSGKALLVMDTNGNAIPTFTALTLPGTTTLSSYKTLKYQIFGVTTSYKQAGLYAIANTGTVASPTSLGNTYSTAIGTGNLISYVSGYTACPSLGSWSTGSFDLTASSTATAIAGITGQALNVGLGLNATSGSVYLIDQVELVP